MTRYRCVDAQKAAGFPVVAACEVMGVSTSAYYEWVERERQGLSERDLHDARLLTETRKIHADHPDYGSPRVTAELARRGLPANHKKVEAMMAAAGIVARRHRRRRNLTKPDETAPAIPDLVGRRLFDPDDVDRTWVGDVTCVPTDEGWLYLASVIDLGSRTAAWLLHERARRHRARDQRTRDGRRDARRADHGRQHDLPLRPRLDLHLGAVPGRL